MEGQVVTRKVESCVPKGGKKIRRQSTSLLGFSVIFGTGEVLIEAECLAQHDWTGEVVPFGICPEIFLSCQEFSCLPDRR